MKDSLENLCEQFIFNRDIIKSAFDSKNSECVIPYCALAFAEKKFNASPDRIREAMRLIRENNTLIKGYRGYGFLLLASVISLSQDMPKRLGKSVMLHNMLLEKIRPTISLPLISSALCDLVPEGKYLYVSERAGEIFRAMKNAHPSVTGGEDSVFALLLALSDLPDDVLIREIEISHKILSEKFTNQNGIQSLSHVLTMTHGKAPEKCKRVFALCDALKAEKCKFPAGIELASLGALSLIPSNIPTLAEETAEVDDYLSRQKGYGFFGHSRDERKMHAAILVCSEHITELEATEERGMPLALISARGGAMVCAVSSVLQNLK